MADDIYTNVRVPGYRVGRFQFQSGILRLEAEQDKETFKRILAQIPSSDRANIELIQDGTLYPFPSDWILRKDLLFAEIEADGVGAQQAARANLGITDSGLLDGNYGGITVSGNGTVVALNGTNPVKYTQSSAATWIITHGLGRTPMGLSFDESGNQIYADYFADDSTASFTFAQPQAGFALLF